MPIVGEKFRDRLFPRENYKVCPGLKCRYKFYYKMYYNSRAL